MAVEESDREDLMREATALRRRMELSLQSQADTVIVGFRSDGAFSIFFGADPVYQFDAQGLLRRSYVNGLLYRTQGTTLSQLTRQRSPGASNLIRHDLSPDELQQFLQVMDQHLQNFIEQLHTGEFHILRQIPENSDLIPALQDALLQILAGATRLAPTIKP